MSKNKVIYDKKLVENYEQQYYKGRPINLNIKVIPSHYNFFCEDNKLGYTLYVNASIKIDEQLYQGSVAVSDVWIHRDNVQEVLQESKHKLVNQAIDAMIEDIQIHASEHYVQEHDKKTEELNIKRKNLSYKAKIAKWILNHVK